MLGRQTARESRRPKRGRSDVREGIYGLFPGECYDPRRSETIRPRIQEADTDIDYEEVRQLLAPSALSPSPSEAQGILCGLVCGGDPRPAQTWLQQLLPASDDARVDLLVAEAREGLARLAHQTLGEIQGSAMGFEILLPEDTVTLEERATALYDWVRGFLFALGLLGLREADLSRQAREVLNDFTQLTHLDLDALDDCEENEAALTEITEFVRVAAMLLYQERVLDRARPAGEAG